MNMLDIFLSLAEKTGLSQGMPYLHPLLATILSLVQLYTIMECDLLIGQLFLGFLNLHRCLANVFFTWNDKAAINILGSSFS
jgi:hypothetical protein